MRNDNNVVIEISAVDKVSNVVKQVASNLLNLNQATRQTSDESGRLAELTVQLSRQLGDKNKVLSSGITLARQLAQGTLDWEKSQQELSTAMSQSSSAVAKETTEKVKNASATRQATEAEKGFLGQKKLTVSELARLTLGVTGVIGAVQLFSRTLSESVQEAQNYQNKLLGLNILANNFGLSQSRIRDAIKEVTADGLITQTTAVESLSNVFANYVTDVDQAVSAIQMFKDFAASGGDASISFDEKVRGLSESFLTQMSILGNQRGLQENWNEIMRVGEQVTGKKAAAASMEGKAMIQLAGLTAIHARAQDAANKYMQTGVGQMQLARTGMANLRLELGNALLPSLVNLAAAFNSSSGGGQVMVQALRGVGVAAMGLMVIIRGLAIGISTLFSAVGGFFSGGTIQEGIQNVVQAVQNGHDEMLNTMAAMQQDIEDIWSGNVGYTLEDVLGNKLPDWAKEGANAAKKALDMQKEIENFKRQWDKAEADFKRNLYDMVQAHLDKKKSLEQDLADETSSYEKENTKRVSDFNRSMEKMSKSHNKRIDDLNDERIDADEDYARRKASIEDQIQEEERKGIYLFGIWNSQADQKKIADLRARLAEEDSEYQKRLAKIQEDIAEENAAYEEQVAEKKMMFEEETTAAREAHEKRTTDLQEQLSRENDILNKHAEEVASVKDMQAEDDIARLVRQHAEENAEAQRQHVERMKQIGEDTAGFTGAWGGAFDAMNKQGEDFKNKLNESLKNAAQNAKTEGTNTGKGWITSFIESVVSKIDELNKKSGGAITNAFSFGPLGTLFNSIGSIKQALGFAHGGIVPGGVGQPVAAIVHGGERVVPATGLDVNGSNAGTVNINFYGNMTVDSPDRVNQITNDVIKALGRQSELAQYGVGY